MDSIIQGLVDYSTIGLFIFITLDDGMMSQYGDYIINDKNDGVYIGPGQCSVRTSVLTVLVETLPGMSTLLESFRGPVSKSRHELQRHVYVGIEQFRG